MRLLGGGPYKFGSHTQGEARTGEIYDSQTQGETRTGEMTVRPKVKSGQVRYTVSPKVKSGQVK